MVTTIGSIIRRADAKAERLRAYQALPWPQRIVELARFKWRVTTVMLYFLRRRMKDGRPWEAGKTARVILRTIFVRRYE